MSRTIFRGRRVATTHYSDAGPVAQSVEQRTFNPKVAGSIPAGPTKEMPGLDLFRRIDASVILNRGRLLMPY